MNPVQRVLDAAGPQAGHIQQLWWFTVAVCAVVFIPLMAVYLWTLWRTPRASEATAPDVAAAASPETRSRRVVVSALVLVTLGLAALLVASVHTDRALARLPLDGAIGIRVIGHQWWWDVYYDEPDPLKTFSTANEIRIPAGKPVLITLQSSDVIHSLWIPNLHGKRDLIPGHTLTMSIQADRPGKYRGQCAEFCGLQHAFMALTVDVLAQADYDKWREAQLTPAPEPASDAQKRGRDLFLSGDCMMCHAIRGTTAQGHQAPDLTHIASRETLGAGRLANTPENLAAWIADPSKFKPGVNMPAHRVPREDLDALVAYLGSLK
jgi:cytochrome c oxidase subunit 2